MITPELLEYVRAEIAKGKTREEINRALISSGGWSEDDLSEVFRIVIPMQNVILPTSPIKPAFSKLPSSSHLLFSLLKFLIILIIISGLGFGAWYYRSQIINLWDSLVNKSSESSVPAVDTTKNIDLNNQENNQAVAPTPDIPPVPVTNVPLVSTPVSIQINSSNNTGIFGNKDDLISFSVLPGQKVFGVMNFIGSIKNSYFFEGNININILDVNQKLLLKGNGTATTKWTTVGPVSFTTTIDFTLLPKGLAYIQIKNDNPSGLLKNDKNILIPVVIE